MTAASCTQGEVAPALHRKAPDFQESHEMPGLQCLPPVLPEASA
ncbi:MAG: hypothetical protein ABI893_14385 [Polaromonas sp.]